MNFIQHNSSMKNKGLFSIAFNRLKTPGCTRRIDRSGNQLFQLDVAHFNDAAGNKAEIC